MSSIHVSLILISGLGVLHGLFLSIFLWNYAKGNQLSNRILSLLLLVLSFRVGKSVFLEFSEDLHIQMIFVGLATLMAIGPLFYLYTRSVADTSFRLHKKYLIHFIPALLGLFYGCWMNDSLANSIPKEIFVMIFVGYYGHYLLYLFFSSKHIFRHRNPELSTDSYAFLRLLFYALLALWFVYVLNLFDETVPYIVGPVLYTLLAYSISFLVTKKGYIKAVNHVKYKTTFVPDSQIDQIFSKVQKLVRDEKQFRESDLTLKSLSVRLNVTPQILSLVINKKGKTNFNNFINHYRIEESMSILMDRKHQNYTIASIAFEVGFNSISSFNTAFKKQTGSTPVAFRKQLSE